MKSYHIVALKNVYLYKDFNDTYKNAQISTVSHIDIIDKNSYKKLMLKKHKSIIIHNNDIIFDYKHITGFYKNSIPEELTRHIKKMFSPLPISYSSKYGFASTPPALEFNNNIAISIDSVSSSYNNYSYYFFNDISEADYMKIYFITQQLPNYKFLCAIPVRVN